MQKQLMECTWEKKEKEEVITLFDIVSLEVDLVKGEMIAHTNENECPYFNSNKYTFTKEIMKTPIKVRIRKE